LKMEKLRPAEDKGVRVQHILYQCCPRPWRATYKNEPVPTIFISHTRYSWFWVQGSGFRGSGFWVHRFGVQRSGAKGESSRLKVKEVGGRKAESIGQGA